MTEHMDSVTTKEQENTLPVDVNAMDDAAVVALERAIAARKAARRTANEAEHKELMTERDTLDATIETANKRLREIKLWCNANGFTFRQRETVLPDGNATEAATEAAKQSGAAKRGRPRKQ